MPLAPPVRGVHRRLSLPAPPARPTLAVWTELADVDDALALALFLVLRRVRDAADAPSAGGARWIRAAEVRVAAATVPEIASDLLLLGGRTLVLSGESRGRAAGACGRLAEWAAEQGFGELAMQLAETAVAVLPGSARRAYEAARMNRRFGRLADAEVLYGRAVGLARQSRTWRVYVRSHLGLGHIAKSRDDLARAAAHFAAAARNARDRSGEKWLAALIEHDLFTLAIDRGEYDVAHLHAERACAWMPTHSDQVPLLVHDYAYFLLKSCARSHAAALLENLLERRLASAEMVLIWSTYAWSVASLGDSVGFSRAASEVAASAGRFSEHAAAAYVNLAFGARALGWRADAEKYARTCAALAKERSELGILQEAMEVLTGEGPVETAETPPTPGMLELIRSLRSRLDVWRGPTWLRKAQAGRRRLGTV